MSRHHEWYRDQWNEFLGRPEYRWRWYNVRWHGLPSATPNPSLWPPLELAVQSGLLGPADPETYPYAEFSMLHAFNRKIHRRFVQSIRFINEITPYFDMLHLGEPLGVNGLGINTPTTHAIHSPVGGLDAVTRYTRYEAKERNDASLGFVANVLEAHDVMERNIATHFFAWLTNYQGGDLEDFQHHMRIGQRGAEFLRICEVIRIPRMEVIGVAESIANFSGYSDALLESELHAWHDFAGLLRQLNNEQGTDSTWPSAMVNEVIDFVTEHIVALVDAVEIRKETYARNRHEYNEAHYQALSSLSESTGISIGEDYD